MVCADLDRGGRGAGGSRGDTRREGRPCARLAGAGGWETGLLVREGGISPRESLQKARADLITWAGHPGGMGGRFLGSVCGTTGQRGRGFLRRDGGRGG